MLETPENPKLLWSLGRLVRGLSALFWGLPLTLLASVETAAFPGTLLAALRCDSGRNRDQNSYPPWGRLIPR